MTYVCTIVAATIANNIELTQSPDPDFGCKLLSFTCATSAT